MTSQTLASTLEGFLSGSSGALVREDGAVLFDLAEAKYSVSGENNKCLIHFWSEERNLVRRVLDVESKGETLRVAVQKIGQPKPVRLEICQERDPRTASAKKATRAGYQRILERVLRRRFPDLTLVIEGLKLFVPAKTSALCVSEWRTYIETPLSGSCTNSMSAKMMCAVTAWSLRGRDCRRNREVFQAFRSWCLARDRNEECWTTAIWQNSRA
jgi:hypothetical protein